MREQEAAGLDIVSDEEIRRESYFNRFATALDGTRHRQPRRGSRAATERQDRVPRVVGEIRRTRPVQVDDVRLLRSSDRPPGQDHVAGSVHHDAARRNEPYDDAAALVLDLAAAVNAEIRDLSRPAPTSCKSTSRGWSRRPAEAGGFAVAAIDRALEGVEGTTVVHMCFGYAHVVRVQPPGYPFLAPLNDCAADQISIESAQPRLDPALRELRTSR